MSQIQKSRKKPREKAWRNRGPKVHRPQGPEELRDEAGKLLSLDSMKDRGVHGVRDTIRFVLLCSTEWTEGAELDGMLSNSRTA